MHDYLISVINDSVDEKIKNEITEFHIKSNNRDVPDFTPFPLIKTLLTNEQIQGLEKTEHPFSGNRISLNSTINSSTGKRKPSASYLKKHDPLLKKTLDDIIIKSFGTFLNNGQISYPYPSGGGLYSAQIIIYLKNIEGYEPGAYHYLAVSNQLERLVSLQENLIEKALFINEESRFNHYDFFILYSSLIDKHVCKYGYRGYRLAMVEIGSMFRNLEIETQKEGLRSRVWGGFNDEALSISLGIDPRVLTPVICQIIGRQ
jgi:SagB-type dehydrogenase family enzyme